MTSLWVTGPWTGPKYFYHRACRCARTQWFQTISRYILTTKTCSFYIFGVRRDVFTHYNDVITDAMAYQITSLAIVYSTVYSGADQRKNQSSASLAFVRGIHRRPVNSPHKGPVTRKMFSFDDAIMTYEPQQNKRNFADNILERIFFKKDLFWERFHWTLILKVISKIYHHLFGKWLGAGQLASDYHRINVFWLPELMIIRGQAITWINDEPVFWLIYRWPSARLQ